MSVLHGAILSPFVRKVRACLMLKGVAYDIKPTMPGSKDPEFRKLSPTGKIPAYSDGGFSLPDSSVICAYLERKHPGAGTSVFPENPEEFGTALWFEEYADTHIFDNSTAKIFFPRIVLKMMKQDHDKEAVKQAIADDLPPIFDYLEAQLDGGNFLVGSSLSIGDIAVVTQMVNLHHAGEGIDETRWPKFAAYVDYHLAQDYFSEAVAEEKALLGR
ncbi:MAG: glutathione S-transferase family protein [Pseudomonadales bacterium]|nr:glutathione S-transferase family protein [Pseudomonadales bacterium]